MTYPIYVTPEDRENHSSSLPVKGTRLSLETNFNPEQAIPSQKPTIILLPGGPGGGMSVYKKHSTALEKIANIIYFSPRGCEESDAGELHTYDMETYVEDIKAIAEFFNLEKVCLLGTSYGSMCALSFAVKYPEKLQALILGSPVASHEFLLYAKKNIAKMETAEQQAQAEKLLIGDFHSEAEVLKFFTTMAPVYSDKARDSGVEDSYFNFPPGSYNWRALIEGFQAPNGFLHHFDVSAQLSNINCPTLIMAGEHDWVNDIELVKNVAKKIGQNAKLITLPCGHSFASDCNQQYIDATREFLDSLT